MPPRVLITGASGFVGRALALEASGRDIPLRIALRRPDALLSGRFDAAAVGELDAETDWGAALDGVEVVVHCAARTHVMRELSDDPWRDFRRTNVEGALQLARQSVRAGVRRFVFISSILVNGPQTSFKPFCADDIPVPSSLYAKSKYEAEIALQDLSRETGLELVVIRPPLIYGPGVKGNFEAMIRWIERGIPLPLGAVNNKRSFIALDNITDFILGCLQRTAAANHTFLISDGEDMSTPDLLRRIGQALGKTVRLFPVPPRMLWAGARLVGKPDMARKLVGSLQVDSSATCKTLNWSPPISVDEAIKRLASEIPPR